MLLAALLVASLLNKEGGGGEEICKEIFRKPLLSVIYKPYSIFAKRLGMNSIPFCTLLGCSVFVWERERNSACTAQLPFKCNNNNRLILVTCVTSESQKDYCSERCG